MLALGLSHEGGVGMLNNSGKWNDYADIWGIPPKPVILMGNNKELVQGRREEVKEKGHLLALI